MHNETIHTAADRDIRQLDIVPPPTDCKYYDRIGLTNSQLSDIDDVDLSARSLIRPTIAIMPRIPEMYPVGPNCDADPLDIEMKEVRKMAGGGGAPPLTAAAVMPPPVFKSVNNNSDFPMKSEQLPV